MIACRKTVIVTHSLQLSRKPWRLPSFTTRGLWNRRNWEDICYQVPTEISAASCWSQWCHTGHNPNGESCLSCSRQDSSQLFRNPNWWKVLQWVDCAFRSFARENSEKVWKYESSGWGWEINVWPYHNGLDGCTGCSQQGNNCTWALGRLPAVVFMGDDV